MRTDDNGPGAEQWRILLVGSAGGHLAQLAALRPWWSSHPRRWVTFDLPDARSRLAEEHVVWAFHPTTRNLVNLLRNFGLSWQVIRSERPAVVITTGAGLAVPFFLVGRWFGAKTVYLEVYDRLTTRTMTARLCRPFTDLFLVQWDEQRLLFPEAHTVGPLL